MTERDGKGARPAESTIDRKWSSSELFSPPVPICTSRFVRRVRKQVETRCRKHHTAPPAPSDPAFLEWLVMASIGLPDASQHEECSVQVAIELVNHLVTRPKQICDHRG